MLVNAQDSIETYVQKIIFRHFPDTLTDEKNKFEEHYPKNYSLLRGPLNYDRGYDLSVRDPFFVVVLNQVAKAQDDNKNLIVADFGYGTGHTTVLLALTGANVVGIENYETEEDHAQRTKLHDYYYIPLSKALSNSNALNFKPGIDATIMPGYDEYARSGEFDFLFMGNFLHMFDPASSQKLVQEHANRMLKAGGTLFASVGGVSTKNDPGFKRKKVYLEAIKNGRKFPTVMNTIEYCTHEEYTSAKINDEGKSENPCRENIREPMGEYLTRTVCWYDSKLIDFVFPSTQWHVTLNKRGIDGHLNNTLSDEDVVKWNIVAVKKTAS